jgi:hypothetical protein
MNCASCWAPPIEAIPPLDAAFFHLDEDERLPDVVGEGDCGAGLAAVADAELGGPADVEEASVAQGLDEAVEVDLRLAFFVAGDVPAGPVGVVGRGLGAVLGRQRGLSGKRHRREARTDLAAEGPEGQDGAAI